MNTYYNTFKREKILNTVLLERYCRLVCNWFKSKYNEEINEITIGWVNDNILFDETTIRFRNNPNVKNKIFTNNTN